MLYEIATLDIKLGTAAAALQGIDAYTKGGQGGTLLGCWTSEIGTLNQIYVLRGFADAKALGDERARQNATTSPFNCGEAILKLATETYAPFPFLPPVAPGRHGKIYEIRTYLLKHGGLAPTLAAWEKAVPDRSKISPLAAAFYSLDGPLRITHIWPFETLSARLDLRTQAVAKGVWPPKGAPDWLTGDMRSTIALPAAFSPLA